METLLLPSYAPFTGALCAVLLLAAIELVGVLVGGLGISDVAEWLVDADTLLTAPWLNWLLVRGLPLSIALVLFTTGFGAAGIAVQAATSALRAEFLPVWQAATVASACGWALLRVGGKCLAPLFETNTSAVSVDTFLGHKAVILSPRCARSSPAEVRVRDEHGQTHMLMVTPSEGQPDFKQGDEVVLQSRTGRAEFSVRKA